MRRVKMVMKVPEVYVKYKKWINFNGKNPKFGWELKPGAPKEAKKLFEEYKKAYLELYEKCFEGK
jgi:hypothetical protein